MLERRIAMTLFRQLIALIVSYILPSLYVVLFRMLKYLPYPPPPPTSPPRQDWDHLKERNPRKQGHVPSLVELMLYKLPWESSHKDERDRCSANVYGHTIWKTQGLIRAPKIKPDTVGFVAELVDPCCA